MYRPDFFLTEYNIYIEHFGVDEHNRAKWLTPFNEQKYVEGMQLKREKHKTHSTKLLETYSHNYHLSREQYAKWGSALVPPIILHNMTEAENAMLDTIKKLESVLSKV